MASDWLKIEKMTPDKPEVFAIARAINISQGEAFYGCFLVWRYFDNHTIDGTAAIEAGQLDHMIGITGFTDAMAQAGWLETHKGLVKLPSFETHNGHTAKRRALDARRKAAGRSTPEQVLEMTRQAAIRAAEAGRAIIESELDGPPDGADFFGTDVRKMSAKRPQNVQDISDDIPSGVQATSDETPPTQESQETHSNTPNYQPPIQAQEAGSSSSSADICPNNVTIQNGHSAEQIRLDKIRVKKERKMGRNRPIFDWDYFVSERLPEDFRTPDMRQAWYDWTEYREEIGRPITAKSLTRQIQQIKFLGPVGAVKAIHLSIQNQWVGIAKTSKEAIKRDTKQGGGKYDDQPTQKI